MSDLTAGAAGDSLQFDTAEPTAANAQAMTCAACAQSIRNVYHQAQGKVVCSSCRARMEGAGGGGYLKALVLGGAAGALGWTIYFAILKLAQMELALVAILVGYLIGRGVKMGSGQRGGRGYQILAVALTYLSITATYVPLLMADESGTTLGLGAALVIALLYPFLSFTTSPIGIVILGVGLWQAWVGTRAEQIEFTGPHPVASPPAHEPALA